MALTLLAVVLFAWILSYVRYGLIGREAYSGIGTELISVNGKLVFWRYNSYHREPPPQNWAADIFEPSSRMGRRLNTEYDFSEAPHFWQRAGLLYFYSDSTFGPDTENLVISIPYVAIVGLLLASYCALLIVSKRPNQALEPTAPSGRGSP